MCLDPPVHEIELECGHTYCFLCAKGLAESGNPKCSLCRRPIAVSKTRQIYNLFQNLSNSFPYFEGWGMGAKSLSAMVVQTTDRTGNPKNYFYWFYQFFDKVDIFKSFRVSNGFKLSFLSLNRRS